MSLDYPTLGLVISAVGTVSLIVIIMLWRINPQEKGLGLWAIAAIVGSLGSASIWLRLLIGFYAIFINNLLALTTTLLVLEGILRFRGIGKEKKRLPYIFWAIVLVGLSSFFNRETPARRYIFNDFFQSTVLFASAIALVYRTKKLERVVHGLTSVFFLIFGTGFVYRWILAVSGNIDHNFQNHPVEGLIFFLDLLWVLGMTLGLTISVNLRVQRRLRSQARRDHLTGLYNRMSLEDFFKLSVAQYARTKSGFGIVLIDINGFKQINDMQGHIYGDAVLKSFSQLLMDSIRKSDLGFRLGGDEFVIILSAIMNPEELHQSCERLKENLAKQITVEKTRLSISISMGSALYLKDGETLDSLLHSADQRMYLHKKEKTSDSSVLC